VDSIQCTDRHIRFVIVLHTFVSVIYQIISCTNSLPTAGGTMTTSLDVLSVFSIFSKRERIRYVCYMLSQIRLSSVTLVHPTQPVEIFSNFSSPYNSPGTLVFSCQNSLVGDAPFPPEICVQSDQPPVKQRNFDQYRLIAPQP